MRITSNPQKLIQIKKNGVLVGVLNSETRVLENVKDRRLATVFKDIKEHGIEVIEGPSAEQKKESDDFQAAANEMSAMLTEKAAKKQTTLRQLLLLEEAVPLLVRLAWQFQSDNQLHNYTPNGFKPYQRRGLQQRFRTLERALAVIGDTLCGTCLFGPPAVLQKAYDEVEHLLLSGRVDRLRDPAQHLQVVARWAWSVIRLFDAPLRDDLKDDMLKTADPMSVNDPERNWELIAQGLAGIIETLSAFSFGGCRSYTHTYSLKDAPLGILLGEFMERGYEIEPLGGVKANRITTQQKPKISAAAAAPWKKIRAAKC